MQHQWFVIIPPIVVLILAVTTKRVIVSLMAGILAAALITSNFSPFTAITLILQKFFEQTNLQHVLQWSGSFDHLYVFSFLLFLGIIISLITFAGGTRAYSKFIEKRIHEKRSAETASLIVSLCFFMDDYFNSLTTGCIMRPLSEHFNIARVKLAFLINTMSSPLCIIIPASSWIAMIIAQLQESGISLNPDLHPLIIGDPWHIYLQSIPFVFYVLILYIVTWYIVRRRIMYGPMRTHEEIAERTGNLYGGKEPLHTQLLMSDNQGTLVDFLLPIGIVICGVITTLLYSGNWHLLGGNHSFSQAVATANVFFALCIGTGTSLIITIFYFIKRKKVHWSSLSSLIYSGFILMKNSLIIILLAWTLSSFLKDDLHTGEYIARLLINVLDLRFLPSLFFIVASLVAASAGSSWGTIAIVIPLALPLVVSLSGNDLFTATQTPFLYAVIGAILSGAIAGAHVSPISDATVMASTSAGAYHIDHVVTQLWYVLPVILGTTLAYTITGFLDPSLPLWSTVSISLLIGLICTLGIITLISYRNNQKY